LPSTRSAKKASVRWPASPRLHALALARQALRQPGRQRLALQASTRTAHAGGVERAEPGALGLLAVQLGQLHQRQHVVGQVLAVALQRFGAVLARLARRDADLDQLRSANRLISCAAPSTPLQSKCAPLTVKTLRSA
jgi:hypothetical protein